MKKEKVSKYLIISMYAVVVSSLVSIALMWLTIFR